MDINTLNNLLYDYRGTPEMLLEAYKMGCRHERESAKSRNKVTSDYIQYIVICLNDSDPNFPKDSATYVQATRKRFTEHSKAYKVLEGIAETRFPLVVEVPAVPIDEDGYPIYLGFESYNDVSKEEYIEDGFGSSWSAICPMCNQKSMFVVRPGSAQCGNCG